MRLFYVDEIWCQNQSLEERIKIWTKWKDRYLMILENCFGKDSWQISLKIPIYSLQGIKYPHLPSKIFKESWHHCLNSCFPCTGTFKRITQAEKISPLSSHCHAFLIYSVWWDDFPMSILKKVPACGNLCTNNNGTGLNLARCCTWQWKRKILKNSGITQTTALYSKEKGKDLSFVECN